MANTVSGLYFYNFDAKMHDYVLRTCQPYFREGNCLEVGSWKGEMTRKLLRYFPDLTCVDPEYKLSDDLDVKFYQRAIEQVDLPELYDNIFLVHTLEHIKNPVEALKSLRKCLKGRLYIVCPNAYAPSRQIAVHMGLISHCTSVTDNEYRHGHYRTYTMDTLEQDIVKSELKVIHRGGVFFKPLANFQLDSFDLSPEYFEGCYQLGKKYPDLCSSLLFICEK